MSNVLWIKREFYYISRYNAVANDANLNCKSLLFCDSYYLKQGKKEKSVHPLLYPLSDMDKVCTDAEETFALILRNTSGEAVGGWLSSL